jgi:Rhodanese-related sulfurtransferase
VFGFGNNGMNYIDAPALRDQLAAGSRPVLLDVREAAELQGGLGAMDGIVHIPLGQLPGRVAELDAYKAEPLVVVCASGARAGNAARWLGAQGFTEVSVLRGGMMAWNALG